MEKILNELPIPDLENKSISQIDTVNLRDNLFDLSENQTEYMDSLTPLDLYKLYYTEGGNFATERLLASDYWKNRQDIKGTDLEWGYSPQLDSIRRDSPNLKGTNELLNAVRSGDYESVAKNILKASPAERRLAIYEIAGIKRLKSFEDNIDLMGKEKFVNCLSKESATEIYKMGGLRFLVRNIELFEGFDPQVLIDDISGRKYFSELDSEEILKVAEGFNLDKKNILKILLDKEGVDFIFMNAERFGLSNGQVFNLLKEVKPEMILEKIDHFPKALHRDIFDMFFEKFPEKILPIFSKFQGIKPSELFSSLEENKKFDLIVQYRDLFNITDFELVQKLILVKKSGLVFNNLNKFPRLRFDDQLAEMLIENGDSQIVLNNIESFDLLSESSAKQLIEKAQLLENATFQKILIILQDNNISRETLSYLDKNASDRLKENNAIKFVQYLGDENIYELFPNLIDRAREIILDRLLVDEDLADYFIENLALYYKKEWVPTGITKAIEHYSVAQKFSHAIKENQVVWMKEEWVANNLKKAKSILKVHNKKSTGGYEGFSQTDQYERHPWLFGSKHAHLVSVLSGAMTTKRDDSELERLEINKESLVEFLSEVNEKINTAYGNFINQISSNPRISEEDKNSLLNEAGDIKMTPLFDNVRNLTIRYLVQSVEGDMTRISEMINLAENLDQILSEGFQKYIKVNEVDVPLYDKLYEEFDNLRETGRYPLEVYLGRDGIYAWVGRRAQDVARRRKMGSEGRRKLKEQGEVIAIHPQYTVYPRYFRDNINYETKREFLEQEGISPDADPLFYDTGYTGTIPEQMMRVMDFDDEDIEKRIRLLSAPSANRRVKGIAENARSEIIEYIEHNAKTENTAVGLIKDPKTGRIRHIAEPTSPQEQFNYMMVKQAIARHYWLKEKLHHEPSGNVNLDSENYTIRIRQEYSKLLPKEFVHDPKTYFAEHGKLLKGSKGEGEYPDEEVVLFKLEDGTEIVAKRIELRKAKEAKKEFSILISAKKAGLPTADPVGFLSGKTDADSSYLLMKKLEGLSGRNFDKQLREMGKFSEEQIAEIMKTVADKNKEMAELFRKTLKIDKRWRIKDTIIEFNTETGEVESVTPIDWERAQDYNPQTPKEIDEI